VCKCLQSSSLTPFFLRYTTSRFSTLEADVPVSSFPIAVVAGVFGKGVGEGKEVDFDMSISTKHANSKLSMVEDEPPRCPVCKDYVTLPWVETGDVLVHSACMEQHRINTADRCLVCDAAILGSFYRVDGGKICADGECKQKHDLANADHCLVCDKAILGSFYPVDGGKKICGKACLQKQKERTSDRCAHCGGPVCKVPGQ
jgi:hypothetical protein